MRDTSKQAYFLIFPELGKLQQKTYNYIKAFPDHTYGELAKISGMGENFRKRGSELEHKGVIKSSGKRICHESGVECHTWRVVQ